MAGAPTFEAAEIRADPDPAPPVPNAAGVVQVEVWLLGISPMVWRRLLVPDARALRELHGMVQAAMGWGGIHLYQSCLRSRRHGPWEVSAPSPDVALAAPELRRGARFAYEYDLNVAWRHEARVEEGRLEAVPGKAHPTCVAGGGARPPGGCGGPRGYLAGLGDASSRDALEDLHTVADILREVVLEDRPEILRDEDGRWELESALWRSRARQRAQGCPLARRPVNARLRKGERLVLVHRQR